MVATKFKPHDNWLPPCYYVPHELEQALIMSGIPSSHWNMAGLLMADLPNLREIDCEKVSLHEFFCDKIAHLIVIPYKCIDGKLGLLYSIS